MIKSNPHLSTPASYTLKSVSLSTTLIFATAAILIAHNCELFMIKWPKYESLQDAMLSLTPKILMVGVQI